jgi:CHASE2 domain-containing sensor protein
MPLLPPPGPARRLARYALAVCILSVAAAVVSFAQGSWLGIVWVLLASLSSNMTWYYARRGKARDRSVTS